MKYIHRNLHYFSFFRAFFISKRVKLVIKKQPFYKDFLINGCLLILRINEYTNSLIIKPFFCFFLLFQKNFVSLHRILTVGGDV